MYSYTVLQFLAVCLVWENMQCCLKDYYWREFEGIVPEDAFAIGRDKKRVAEFIGQVLYKDRLVPAKISQNGQRVYFEWFFLDYPVALNIKIMCTRQPQKFQWLQAEKGAIINRNSNLFIKGGYEQSRPRYIGRVVKFGNASIGKAVCTKDSCDELYAASQGIYKQHPVFEILSCNPEIESVDFVSNPNVDVRQGQ